MTVRILGYGRQLIGTLHLPATTKLADLENLRRLGAQCIEVIAA